MLRRSSETIIMKDKYSREYYFNRNRYLLDYTGVLLVAYDMQANKRSGTGYTVHRVQTRGKPFVAIDPDNFSVSFSIMEYPKNILPFFQKIATSGGKTVLYG